MTSLIILTLVLKCIAYSIFGYYGGKLSEYEGWSRWFFWRGVGVMLMIESFTLVLILTL